MICGSRQERLAGREFEGTYGPCVPLEFQDLIARGHIPDQNDSIFVAGGKPLAVGTKCDRTDMILVANESAYYFS